MVVRPQSVGPRGSRASCLSFALQLALVLQVPVGSLFPYGSHPSRWGHPCGVEASLSSIGTKVYCVFSFPLGCFFVLSLPFGIKSPYVSGVLVSFLFCATDGCRRCCALSPYGWASNLCLRLLFAPCHYRCVSWWSSLRTRVFGCP